MKYIAAYLLAKLEKENPSIEDIKRIVQSVGIEFEEKKVQEILQKLEGKDINEVIKDGKSKLTVISNPQTTKDNQQQQQETNNENNENNENKGNEEEETMELGNDLGDLFN